MTDPRTGPQNLRGKDPQCVALNNSTCPAVAGNKRHQKHRNSMKGLSCRRRRAAHSNRNAAHCRHFSPHQNFTYWTRH